MTDVQDTQTSIIVTQAREQQGLRLLELPPDLLSIIEDKADPLQRLSIKSAPPSTDAKSLPAEAYHVVLCTADTTYRLTQIQTSNSVFVVRPTESANTHSSDPSHQADLCVFATCSNTVEVSRLDKSDSSKQRSVVEWLEASLLPFDLDQAGSASHAAVNGSKEDLIKDIPFSNGECEHAWMRLIAFEDRGACFRPSPKTLLELWRCVFTIYEANSDAPLKEQVLLMREQAVQELDCPHSLVDALLALTVLATSNEAGVRVPFQKEVTMTVVGDALCEQRSHEGANAVEEDARLLQQWRDILPHQWHDEIKLAQVAALKGRAAERERRRDVRELAENMAPSVNLPSNEKRKPTGPPGKRNWHERLKRNK